MIPVDYGNSRYLPAKKMAWFVGPVLGFVIVADLSASSPRGSLPRNALWVVNNALHVYFPHVVYVVGP